MITSKDVTEMKNIQRQGVDKIITAMKEMDISKEVILSFIIM